MQETMTYRQWMEGWCRKREDVVKASTAASYAEIVEKHILPALGQLGVGEITEPCLQAAALRWLSEGRCDGKGGLSERTVRGMVALVTLSLKAAAREGYAPPRQYDIAFPPQQSVRKLPVFSEDEQALLM